MILDLPGSVGQTKTPTDCCARIFRVAPICPCTARPSSVPSQGSSMKGRERPCSIRRRLRSSQNVLQRSVELARQSGRSISARGWPERVAQVRTRRTAPPDQPAADPSSIQVSAYTDGINQRSPLASTEEFFNTIRHITSFRPSHRRAQNAPVALRRNSAHGGLRRADECVAVCEAYA